MFILEERVLNDRLHRYSVLSCRRELDLPCMALEGRIRASGADFGSA